MPLNDELIPLYPEILLNQEFHIRVSERHEVYVASYGNPDGIPIAVLHGGPGSGTRPSSARYFDPTKYHIILSDQRGAGKSLPKGEMRDNTTQDLIADLEIIRSHFKIDKWAVFGGSWGSTLALLYGEAHPERVMTLFLRGIFLGRKDDISALVRDDSPAALFHSKEWRAFKEKTQRLIDRAGLSDSLTLADNEIYDIYYELLQQPDEQLCIEAAETIALWEALNSYLIPDYNITASPDDVNMGLTEATYFKNRCFINHNQILDNIQQLRDVPVIVIQGLYDTVCPSYMADELEEALRAINPEPGLVVRKTCIAGHSQRDPEIRHALIAATNEFAQQFELAKGKISTVSECRNSFFRDSAGPAGSELGHVDRPAV